MHSMPTDSFLSISSLPNSLQRSFHTTTLLHSMESAILKVSNDLIVGRLDGFFLEFILLDLVVTFTNVDHFILSPWLQWNYPDFSPTPLTTSALSSLLPLFLCLSLKCNYSPEVFVHGPHLFYSLSFDGLSNSIGSITFSMWIQPNPYHSFMDAFINHILNAYHISRVTTQFIILTGAYWVWKEALLILTSEQQAQPRLSREN